MKKVILACIATMLCTGASAQDSFSFWKKDREYAENAFSINTSGPVPGVGFSFDRQLSKKATLTVFYGEPIDAVEITADSPLEVEGVNYTGEIADESSSWVGFNLSFRPIDALQGFRVAAGAGVGVLAGSLSDPDGNTYNGSFDGTFGYAGVGYGLRPVKGLRLGVDIGLIQTTQFDVVTDGQTMEAGSRAMTLTKEFTGWIPNLQLTAGWGF